MTLAPSKADTFRSAAYVALCAVCGVVGVLGIAVLTPAQLVTRDLAFIYGFANVGPSLLVIAAFCLCISAAILIPSARLVRRRLRTHSDGAITLAIASLTLAAVAAVFIAGMIALSFGLIVFEGVVVPEPKLGGPDSMDVEIVVLLIAASVGLVSLLVGLVRVAVLSARAK